MMIESAVARTDDIFGTRTGPADAGPFDGGWPARGGPARPRRPDDRAVGVLAGARVGRRRSATRVRRVRRRRWVCAGRGSPTEYVAVASTTVCTGATAVAPGSRFRWQGRAADRFLSPPPT